MEKLLIIIPAHNEAENIEQVVNEFLRDYPEYHYLVVNDGSTDDTAKICKVNGFNFLDLPINLGLSGAVRSGMKYAYRNGYSYAMQFDGDGQHNPKYIKPMMDAMLLESADIVIGSRYKGIKKPFSLRMIGSRLLECCVNVHSKTKLSDVTSGMRLYNEWMIKQFATEMNSVPEPDSMAFFLRCGVKIIEVKVEMSERQLGESYLDSGQAIKYMIRMLFSILLFQKVRKPIKE